MQYEQRRAEVGQEVPEEPQMYERQQKDPLERPQFQLEHNGGRVENEEFIEGIVPRQPKNLDPNT